MCENVNNMCEKNVNNTCENVNKEVERSPPTTTTKTDIDDDEKDSTSNQNHNPTDVLCKKQQKNGYKTTTASAAEVVKVQLSTSQVKKCSAINRIFQNRTVLLPKLKTGQITKEVLDTFVENRTYCVLCRDDKPIPEIFRTKGALRFHMRIKHFKELLQMEASSRLGQKNAGSSCIPGKRKNSLSDSESGSTDRISGDSSPISDPETAESSPPPMLEPVLRSTHLPIRPFPQRPCMPIRNRGGQNPENPGKLLFSQRFFMTTMVEQNRENSGKPFAPYMPAMRPKKKSVGKMPYVPTRVEKISENSDTMQTARVAQVNNILENDEKNCQTLKNNEKHPGKTEKQGKAKNPGETENNQGKPENPGNSVNPEGIAEDPGKTTENPEKTDKLKNPGIMDQPEIPQKTKKLMPIMESKLRKNPENPLGIQFLPRVKLKRINLKSNEIVSTTPPALIERPGLTCPKPQPTPSPDVIKMNCKINSVTTRVEQNRENSGKPFAPFTPAMRPNTLEGKLPYVPKRVEQISENSRILPTSRVEQTQRPGLKVPKPQPKPGLDAIKIDSEINSEGKMPYVESRVEQISEKSGILPTSRVEQTQRPGLTFPKPQQNPGLDVIKFVSEINSEGKMSYVQSRVKQISEKSGMQPTSRVEPNQRPGLTVPKPQPKPGQDVIKIGSEINSEGNTPHVQSRVEQISENSGILLTSRVEQTQRPGLTFPKPQQNPGLDVIKIVSEINSEGKMPYVHSRVEQISEKSGMLPTSRAEQTQRPGLTFPKPQQNPGLDVIKIVSEINSEGKMPYVESRVEQISENSRMPPTSRVEQTQRPGLTVPKPQPKPGQDVIKIASEINSEGKMPYLQSRVEQISENSEIPPTSRVEQTVPATPQSKPVRDLIDIEDEPEIVKVVFAPPNSPVVQALASPKPPVQALAPPKPPVFFPVTAPPKQQETSKPDELLKVHLMVCPACRIPFWGPENYRIHIETVHLPKFVQQQLQVQVNFGEAAPVSNLHPVLLKQLQKPKLSAVLNLNHLPGNVAQVKPMENKEECALLTESFEDFVRNRRKERNRIIPENTYQLIRVEIPPNKTRIYKHWPHPPRRFYSYVQHEEVEKNPAAGNSAAGISAAATLIPLKKIRDVRKKPKLSPNLNNIGPNTILEKMGKPAVEIPPPPPRRMTKPVHILPAPPAAKRAENPLPIPVPVRIRQPPQIPRPVLRPVLKPVLNPVQIPQPMVAKPVQIPQPVLKPVQIPQLMVAKPVLQIPQPVSKPVQIPQPAVAKPVQIITQTEALKHNRGVVRPWEVYSENGPINPTTNGRVNPGLDCIPLKKRRLMLYELESKYLKLNSNLT
jgi:hypothetical protein